VWTADCAVVKKFRKILTWAKPEPKAGGFPVSCAQPIGFFFCKQKVPIESVHFEGVPLRIETHQISTIPNGKPQTHKNFRGPEICFIAPIQRRNIAEFNGRPTVIFQIRAKVDIARKSLRGTAVSN